MSKAVEQKNEEGTDEVLSAFKDFNLTAAQKKGVIETLNGRTVAWVRRKGLEIEYLSLPDGQYHKVR